MLAQAQEAIYIKAEKGLFLPCFLWVKLNEQRMSLIIFFIHDTILF